jgi:predicted dehydrogenase
VRVGVIGAGFGRRVVAPVFAATDGCEVVDVVSARDDAAIEALVARPDVDLVSVHSPPYLHAPHVRRALAVGKAVLCDKPFALDADEAAGLEAEARDAGVVALCNFEFRYAPARGLLRDLVHDGTTGTVQHVQWVHCSAGSRVPLRRWGWLFDRDLGGGWIGAWGSHAIDTLRFCFATEVADVDARLRIDVPVRPDAEGAAHRCTAEDGFSASLALTSGPSVAIDSGFAAVANVVPRLTVFGTDAVVEVVADERIVIRHAGRDNEVVDVSDGGDDRHLEPMRRWAEVVRDAVHTSEVPNSAPTFGDGRACDEVLERLRAAPFVVREEDEDAEEPDEY